MNLHPQRRPSPELNLTPLIDVVFLLLIFFMVSTTFDKESRIKVELPQAATQDEKPTEEKLLDIVVDAKGRYYINQKEVINTEAKTLKLAIEKEVGERRDLPLIINADAQATHQSVVKVMDVASQLGFVHMTFAARQPVDE
ncbi:MAG: biopolymer transporter ExbD [Candidatus Sedimenticola endophacoides]|uniref:Biopolymer transporter ExbD n=1 Tax=Candidatus Sedimenticola endophacoides TaxID=2548426 RepID=A0A657Q823_9GAMM|nr:MAG: biopolymer transporter ExbD [Candidatus Sedimenticola endophacoides]OQX32930.1 MAG: biopolymer transporter ExbD [Candidatus Sedimenticola endophacoides]OQX37964.1 MAG: biopolymer transporter ExbD [Candidatus Sedimenticola endophacoides]OQX41889.1 MAG: biopolymer transporter ExbD [Candidatus Sedimenticola endophacoides]OQX43710.1 MAG: biopolymer transporter ExbD [Candidatus Sedimenticola endophacoides]